MTLPNLAMLFHFLAVAASLAFGFQLHTRQAIANTTSLQPGFNPLATDNLAVYFGHSPENSNASLSALCTDTNIDVVIIGFIRAFNGLNVLPMIDFTQTCSYRTWKGPASTMSCPALAAEVNECQSFGKKILISIGGSSSNTSFNSSRDAMNAAQTLWNTFGAGNETPASRPFGNVTVDGFDIDHEQGSTAYYEDFAVTLRNLSATTAQKLFISAAPLCANTSNFFSPAFYQQTDFVFVRFYNAMQCDLGNEGFNASLATWYQFLKRLKGASSLLPRLYIGGLSFDNSNSDYLSPESFAAVVNASTAAVFDRFGGVMLWDGTNGQRMKGDNGETFVQITKMALTR